MDETPPPEPLTDEQLDTLHTEIINDRRIVAGLFRSLTEKEHRYQVELDRRRLRLVKGDDDA